MSQHTKTARKNHQLFLSSHLQNEIYSGFVDFKSFKADTDIGVSVLKLSIAHIFSALIFNRVY